MICKDRKRKFILISVIFLLIAVIVLLMMLLTDKKNVDKPKSRTEIRIDAFIDENRTEIFNSSHSEGTLVEVREGQSFKLICINDSEYDADISLLLNIENVEFKTVQHGSEHDIDMNLKPGEQYILEGNAIKSLYLNEGVILKHNNNYILCAGNEQVLKKFAGETIYSGSKLILSNNIKLDENLEIKRPGKIVIGKYNLSVDGEVWLNTDEAGTFSIEKNGSGELNSDGFYAEAVNCSFLDKNKTLKFEDRPSYYLRVSSFNDKEIDCTNKIIRSEDELLRLIDNKMLPDLRPGDTITLDCDIDLKNAVNLNIPVNIQVSGKLSVEESISICTRDSGKILINLDNKGVLPIDKLYIEAPMCNMLWKGKDVPEIQYISERMNVRSFNGEDMINYGMGGPGENKIVSFSMNKDENPKAKEKLQWSIEGNKISVSVSYLVSEACLKEAVLDIKSDGGTISFNKEAVNSNGTVNLLNNCFCIVTDENGKIRSYKVQTDRVMCKLPVVEINTDDGKAIVSKKEYKSGTVEIKCDEGVGYPSLKRAIAGIRGRGNSTWNWAKKPFKIKFEDKVSVLGMSEAKEWTLLANYSDKSLIRNYVAMEMAKELEHLSFTPSQIPVDVFFNGEYIGIYTMGEQIEMKSGRVEEEETPGSADTSYLLEVGGADEGDEENENYFTVGELRFVTINDPDEDEITPEQFNFIKEYAKKANDAVVSLKNYEEYIDIDSLIDWVIIHEWSFNLDCCFRRSCFMIKEKGGRLKMGPIWDFDLAFGNFSKDGSYKRWASLGSEDGYVKTNWMNHLMKDSDFMNKFKLRWNEVKERILNKALSSIDMMSELIDASQKLNFQVWKIWNTRTGYQPNAMVKINTYEKQIIYLKDFIKTRYDWIDKQLNQ